jgi:hypothetical protein
MSFIRLGSSLINLQSVKSVNYRLTRHIIEINFTHPIVEGNLIYFGSSHRDRLEFSFSKQKDADSAWEDIILKINATQNTKMSTD